ncbi:MAG: hypothetical protein ACE5EI_10390 [Thermodesulfobacteriota bacterium]
MIKVKTFTSQLKIFHVMDEIHALDRLVNEFISSKGVKKVIGTSDSITTGLSGETIGIVRLLTYEEPGK